MAPDRLAPNDPRVEHQYVVLNGQTYHYLLGNPNGPARGTIFCIHGWPDFSFGWRYQVPALLSAGYRVVVPDMMGYSHSSAPESLEFYTTKCAADDMAELAKHLDCPRIILLGHDWGGSIVWRIAMYKPQLVHAVMSVCTPFDMPKKEFAPLEDIVKTRLPNFTYQLQLASGEVEKHIKTKEQIRQFLNAMYGGRGPNGELGFNVNPGIIYENLPKLQPTRLMSPEELDYYADCWARHGVHSTLNWYRVRELNFRDEKVLADRKGPMITMPALFILAKKDAALPPKMSATMDRHFANLTRGEVDAGHWALWQAPDQCNKLILDFLKVLPAFEQVKAHL
jgi:pimeloyl-ACP methyl ester carboxylesterase